jgi:hypothetical protein
MTSGGGGSEWDAGEFAAEVGGVAFAIVGVVQDGVDVVEDVPLGNGRVGVREKTSESTSWQTGLFMG